MVCYVSGDLGEVKREGAFVVFCICIGLVLLVWLVRNVRLLKKKFLTVIFFGLK